MSPAAAGDPRRRLLLRIVLTAVGRTLVLGNAEHAHALAPGLESDLSVTLSAAAQDVGARILARVPGQGSAAGAIAVTALPEPATAVIFGAGALGYARWRCSR